MSELKHGYTVTHKKLYHVWHAMKKRCKNPNNINYGGRGITFCSEWEKAENFCDWALNNGYKEGLELDRIDVNGNYCPENCRWITFAEQQRNTSRSRFVTANGQTKTIAEWAEITGIRADVIKDRLNKLNWSEQEAVTIPTMRMGGKRWLR